MADNLIQKKGESTWYVRLAVPADVQKKLGAKVLVQSLKTGLRREAMERRLPILAAWKAKILQARQGIPLPNDWQNEVIQISNELDQLTQNRKLNLVGVVAPPLPAINAEIEARLKNNPRLVAAFEAFAKEHLKDGMAGKVRLLDEINNKFRLMIPKAMDRIYNLSSDRQAEITSIVMTPSIHRKTSLFTNTRLTAFREFREGRGGAAKHIDQQVSKMERLHKYLSEHNLKLDFDAVDKWLQSLDRAPKTLSQYLMAGTAFWKWAIKYDTVWREEYKGKVNPFIGHDLPQGGGSETAGQDREIYSKADAIKLHKGALERGDQALADLIMFGWYTGGRIEELTQLTKESVILVDGIECFDFPKSKTKASKRIVPVHPELKPTVRRLIETTTDGYLIPTSSKNQYSKRSHAISKAFGRLRTASGFSPLYVFHSFRHTVVTELIRADVPDALAKELVGHETGSVTHDTYSKGATSKQKLEAITKLPKLT